MLVAGEEPLYVLRRLTRAAVEPDRWADELAEVADQVIGLQDPTRVS